MLIILWTLSNWERHLPAEFAETLPAQCPPADAEEGELEAVYRLTENGPPRSGDFASKAALGESCPPDISECDWASCSLYRKAKSLRKYTRLREERPYLVKLSIPNGAGKFKLGSSKRGHVDFWRYSGTCLTNFVVEIEGPQNDD